MNKLTKTLIVVLFLFSGVILAQQNAVMTHYTVNPYLYNPSQVGENGYVSVQTHYRKQWINMPNAPDTKLLSAQGMINNKFGIGGKIYLDKAHIIQNFGALFSYAYYIRFKKNPNKHYFSLGLSAGFKAQRLAFNEATIKDDFDPSIFYNGATNTVFDSEAGLTYRFKGLRLAGFVANLAPQSYQYERASTYLKYEPSYHVYGAVSYDIVLGKNSNFSLKPSMLVRYIPDIPIQFDGNLLLDWKNLFWIGGGYRYKNVGVWSTAGFRVHDMVSFTYSYEQSIDGFQAALGSTHEITMEFRFKPNKNKDLAKEMDDRYADLKKKILVKHNELLDSIQELKERTDSLESALNNTNELIRELKETATNTVYKGNQVKYAALGKVNYFLNSATIHSAQKVEAKPIMEQIKALQEEGKLILIRIEGSASIEGSETYNLLLSNKRNESMKEYLVKNGIKDDLITTSSKGNSEALVRDNAFEDIENTEPNPEDRYVKVYILFNE